MVTGCKEGLETLLLIKKNAQEEILYNGKKNDRQKVLDELIERTLQGWKADIFE